MLGLSLGHGRRSSIDRRQGGIFSIQVGCGSGYRPDSGQISLGAARAVELDKRGLILSGDKVEE